jgi:hypothetical protein
VKEGFIVIATLPFDPHRRSPAISSALRNRFVTVAVEEPIRDTQLREPISAMVIDKATFHLASIDVSRVPEWMRPKEFAQSEVRKLAQVVAQRTVNNDIVRDIAFLARIARNIFGLTILLEVSFNNPEPTKSP